MSDSSRFRRTDARVLLLVPCAFLAVAAGAAYGGAPPGAQTAPPKNRAKPTIVGELRVGETVTASPGAWRGRQPMLFAYQWISCTRRVSNCISIRGATQSSYWLRRRDLGRRLIVSVTATNRDGGASAQSNASAVIRRRAG